MFKNLFALTIISTLFFLLSACGKDTTDQYESIVDRGYIIAGLDDTFAPLGFRDNDGNIVGFDIDLSKAVFEEMGLEVRYQPIDWKMKETELNGKNIDVIWNGYTITEEREKLVNFSDPYLSNRQVIVVMSDSNVSVKSDLAGKEVGVQAASSSYGVLEDLDITNSFKNGEPTQFNTNDLAFRDLEYGRIDAIVVDEILARYYITLKDDSNFKVLSEDFGSEEYGVGMRQTDLELTEKFNEAFQTIKDSDTANDISIKWFGEDIILK